jgi:type IV pilus assembly protein PilY1
MTNFANWWAYYQTRLQSMKTSVSRAFKTLDNRFRVGFTVISYSGATNGATFLGNNTFELTQKNKWFTTLFAQSSSGSTPLRGALAKAGRYYANKVSGQVDPLQYSCQQNFTIISTDGYWNLGSETSAYKNNNLTGGLVGDMDGGTTTRPMYEGPTASSGSLADIAKFYYDTDLRTSALGNCAGGTSPDFPAGNPDVCTNNVFVSSTDNNVKQHMTTFTMGLGAEGTLDFTSDYLTATSGDYYNLKNGLGSPTVNWPDPQVASASNSVQERIDDLWHAAVNGQGIYFSAKNPDQIIAGLNTALSSITAKLGSAAAAATSTLNPVAGNNFAYVASYTTVKWIGNLESRSINTATGVVSETAGWCAENVVATTCAAPGAVVTDTSGSSTNYNCVVSGATSATCTAPGVFDSVSSNCTTPIANACTGTMAAKVGATTDTRNIYTAPAGGLVPLTGQNLVPFDAAYAIANPTNFAAAHISTLNQWGALTGTQQTAAAGLNLINYLRGQNGHEFNRTANAAVDQLYRNREAVLGDALESQPAFIGKPVFSYPYAGYSDYVTAQAGRAGTVYMGTNDGMMHAFAASDGKERWAYVPSMVIPNMWKLASTSYSGAHANFANGSAITSDIYCPGTCGGASASWRTILVAGLNGGGRGYYALDITVPATPTLLWEFTPTTGIGAVKNDDVGYSFGQPVITRKADGTWVVMVTSGYNNTSPGDGKGYLFVLDASTGAIISKIATGMGDTTTPSGLAKIAGWNDDPAGNKVGYVYGGDLLGNVWRFDINSSVANGTGVGTVPTGAAMQFAILKDPLGIVQPITTTPVLGKIVEKRVVFIGTGKYLETGDLTTTQKQTQYAIKDDDATTTLVNPRTTLVNQTLTNNPNGTATRLSSGNTVNFLTGRGWYVDFPDGGSGGVGSERVNIDGKLVEGTLLVPTIVPSSTVCSPGGYGWLNFFDYTTGGAVTKGNTGTGLASVKYDSTIVGVNVIYIQGAPKVEVVTSTNPTPEIDKNPAFNPTAAGFTGKRVTWRELIQ